MVLRYEEIKHDSFENNEAGDFEVKKELSLLYNEFLGTNESQESIESIEDIAKRLFEYLDINELRRKEGESRGTLMENIDDGFTIQDLSNYLIFDISIFQDETTSLCVVNIFRYFQIHKNLLSEYGIDISFDSLDLFAKMQKSIDLIISLEENVGDLNTSSGNTDVQLLDTYLKTNPDLVLKVLISKVIDYESKEFIGDWLEESQGIQWIKSNKSQYPELELVYASWMYDKIKSIINDQYGIIDISFFDLEERTLKEYELRNYLKPNTINYFLEDEIFQLFMKSSLEEHLRQRNKGILHVIDSVSTIGSILEGSNDVLNQTNAVINAYNLLYDGINETQLDSEYSRILLIHEVSKNLLLMDATIDTLLDEEEKGALSEAEAHLGGTINELLSDLDFIKSSRVISRLTLLLEADRQKIPLLPEALGRDATSTFNYQLRSRSGGDDNPFFTYTIGANEQGNYRTVDMSIEQRQQAQQLLILWKQYREKQIMKLLSSAKKVMQILNSHQGVFKIIDDNNLISRALVDGGREDAGTEKIGLIDLTSIDDSPRGVVGREYSFEFVDELKQLYPSGISKTQYEKFLRGLFMNADKKLFETLMLEWPTVLSPVGAAVGAPIFLDMTKFPHGDVVVKNHSTLSSLAAKRQKGEYLSFFLDVVIILGSAGLASVLGGGRLISQGLIFYGANKGLSTLQHIVVDGMGVGEAAAESFGVYATDRLGRKRLLDNGDNETHSFRRVTISNTVEFGMGTFLFSGAWGAIAKKVSPNNILFAKSNRGKATVSLGSEAAIFTGINNLLAHPIQEGIIGIIEGGVDQLFENLGNHFSKISFNGLVHETLGNMVFIGSLKAGKATPGFVFSKIKQLAVNRQLKNHYDSLSNNLFRLENAFRDTLKQSGISLEFEQGRFVMKKNGRVIEERELSEKAKNQLHALHGLSTKLLRIEQAMRLNAKKSGFEEYNTLIEKNELIDPIKTPEDVLIEKIETAKRNGNESEVKRLETLAVEMIYAKEVHRAKTRFSLLQSLRKNQGVIESQIPSTISEVISRSVLERAERETKMREDFTKQGREFKLTTEQLDKLYAAHEQGKLFGGGRENSASREYLNQLISEGVISKRQSEFLQDWGYAGFISSALFWLFVLSGTFRGAANTFLKGSGKLFGFVLKSSQRGREMNESISNARKKYLDPLTTTYRERKQKEIARHEETIRTYEEQNGIEKEKKPEQQSTEPSGSDVLSYTPSQKAAKTREINAQQSIVDILHAKIELITIVITNAQRGLDNYISTRGRFTENDSLIKQEASFISTKQKEIQLLRQERETIDGKDGEGREIEGLRESRLKLNQEKIDIAQKAIDDTVARLEGSKSTEQSKRSEATENLKKLQEERNAMEVEPSPTVSSQNTSASTTEELHPNQQNRQRNVTEKEYQDAIRRMEEIRHVESGNATHIERLMEGEMGLLSRVLEMNQIIDGYNIVTGERNTGMITQGKEVAKEYRQSRKTGKSMPKSVHNALSYLVNNKSARGTYLTAMRNALILTLWTYQIEGGFQLVDMYNSAENIAQIGEYWITGDEKGIVTTDYSEAVDDVFSAGEYLSPARWRLYMVSLIPHTFRLLGTVYDGTTEGNRSGRRVEGKYITDENGTKEVGGSGRFSEAMFVTESLIDPYTTNQTPILNGIRLLPEITQALGIPITNENKTLLHSNKFITAFVANIFSEMGKLDPNFEINPEELDQLQNDLIEEFADPPAGESSSTPAIPQDQQRQQDSQPQIPQTPQNPSNSRGTPVPQRSTPVQGQKPQVPQQRESQGNPLKKVMGGEQKEGG